jgi:hypothetical protein
VLGWLTGIGALAIPGLGPLIAAGPIVAALAGVGAVGAVGGVIGALAGMGVPEYEAKRFEGRIKQGGVLMSVHCDNDDWVKRARECCGRPAPKVSIGRRNPARISSSATSRCRAFAEPPGIGSAVGTGRAVAGPRASMLGGRRALSGSDMMNECAEWHF